MSLIDEFGTEAAADKHIFLLYSEKKADALGYCMASVPDGKGGKKEIPYTLCTEDLSSGHWDDEQVVWEGKRSDFLILESNCSLVAKVIEQACLKELGPVNLKLK